MILKVDKMSISAVYRKGVIKPLEKLDLAENEKIEIEIKKKKSIVDEISGKLKLKQDIIDELVESEDVYAPEGF